ncbi:MAG: penicillin acylase family protein, partial [Solirubrobacterales bacterium]
MLPGLSAKRLTGLGAGVIAAGAVAAGLWQRIFRRSLPQTSGRLAVDGISGRVEIRRDRWGVPHVRADSIDDLWFGQGFCHGQDRLWQLDLYRRLACGRVAEIAGAEGLAVDRFTRTLGIRRAALAEEAALDGALADAMGAYAAGVNAAASAAPAPAELQLLRIDFEPWRPADTLTLTKLLALGLSTNWERELLRADMARELGPELAARLDPGYPAGNPVVLAPGEPWRGDGAA